MQFSTEPLKRHGDGRKTEMRLHSLTKLLRSPDKFFYLFAKLWHSPDKRCVCFQNINGGKNEVKGKTA